MAFKMSSTKPKCPETPVALFQDLPRRKHPSLYDHQGQVLRDYHANALVETDVALQLPTGSGKTLVGLLIAEWRRRKYSEKVLYLCPTRQLVNQVVKQANEEYGINAEAFSGSKREYSPKAKTAYQDAGKVCVTTYSSLFNISPFLAARTSFCLTMRMLPISTYLTSGHCLFRRREGRCLVRFLMF